VTTADAPSTQPAPDGSADGRNRRLRAVASAIVGVIAVICILAGVVGFWTVRTATNSERFENRIEELLMTEEISNSLARRVVEDVAVALDVRARLNEVIPAQLQPITDVLLAGVRSRVETRVGEMIRSENVASTIAQAAGRAHEAAVDVLEGEDAVAGVTVDDGQVRINLLPLTARVLTAMQEVGLFSDVTIPTFDRTGDPDEQRAELSAALGRDLPEDFGEPVVFRSDSLDRLGDTVQSAQDLLLLARRIFWVLLLGGLALGALSIWLARYRLRAAAYLVAGLFAAALVVRLVGSAASDRLPNAVKQPGAQFAVADIASNMTESLNDTLTTFCVIVLIGLGIAGWLVVGEPWRRARKSGQPAA
jgi:hypothetical protein